MKKNQPSIDGFVPRRPGSPIGGLHTLKHPERRVVPIDRSLHTGDNIQATTVGLEREQRPIGRTDIDESLREIDQQPEGSKKHRKGRKDKREKRPKSLKKKIVIWTIVVLLTLVVLAAGYFFAKSFFATHSIFKGSIFDLVQSQPLKEDENGRSNFIIVGTSEDDPGHGGAYLTDSMLVLSIDQKNKNAYMFSIPRDLWVEYGMACNSGYQGKINEYFNCVNDDYDTPAAETERLEGLRSFVGDIIGMDVQYAVHVNNTVIKQAVDAVGGVDVDIQGSNGAPGVYDRNFDWRCNYTCYLVKYDNGIHHLDGEHALFLSMARGDVEPTYGLGNSNFDREKNQQKIIVALKDKATSTGTLTNLSTVTKLIDALGSNLRTNIETKEIQTLMKLGNDIKSQDIIRLDLFGGDDKIFTYATFGSSSAVAPVAGAFNYTALQAYLDKKLSNNPIVSEGANITVLNGSGTVGAGQTVADSLTAQGFTIDDVANAPEGTYDAVEIYQIATDKPKTAEKLQSLYSVTVKTTAPPVSVTGETDFVIIVGKAPAATGTTTQ